MEEDVATFDEKGRRLFESELTCVSHADSCMWAELKKKPHVPLPLGCRTVLMALFAGCMVLSALVAGKGYLVSQPTDIELDGADLTWKSWQKVIDIAIERDDPFVLAISFPCHPWNSWAEFNATRSKVFAEEVQMDRESQLPMLKWIAEKVEQRAKMGLLQPTQDGSASRWKPGVRRSSS